jgi:hypothetical protein
VSFCAYVAGHVGRLHVALIFLSTAFSRQGYIVQSCPWHIFFIHTVSHPRSSHDRVSDAESVFENFA